MLPLAAGAADIEQVKVVPAAPGGEPAQHEDIAELVTRACTITRWESERACAVLTA
jgi:hypothetical protein